jgi:hypothetical protein
MVRSRVGILTRLSHICFRSQCYWLTIEPYKQRRSFMFEGQKDRERLGAILLLFQVACPPGGFEISTIRLRRSHIDDKAIAHVFVHDALIRPVDVGGTDQ